MLPIFPKAFDNNYRGQWLAVPFLALAALTKLAMSTNAIIMTRTVVEQADHIDLSRYGADATTFILFLHQAWALGHGLLALLAVLALIRYRTMMPLTAILMLAEQFGRKVLGLVNPIPGVPHDASSIGFLVTQGLYVVLLIALVLSLWPRASTKV